MNQLSAGFARVNITPPIGIPLAGYYKERFADTVLDELEATALALSLGDTKIVMLSVDHLGIRLPQQEIVRPAIAKATGLPEDCIFVASTHTHTGPLTDKGVRPEMEEEYFRFLTTRLVDVSCFALRDLAPAKMGWAVGKAPHIAFIRRYLMKDGTICTNPGIRHPEIVAPLGEVDESVPVLRFDREDKDNIVLVNFGCHPDTVGGNNISADWPGFARRMVEKSLDNTCCIFFNGAQGDINHVDTNPSAGDLNDMTLDFDDVMRGYGHARHMGNVVAGAVLQVYDKATYVPVNNLSSMQKVIRHPSNRPEPEDLPQARLYNELHQAGRDSEIPFTGMLLTAAVAEAERMLNLEHGPDDFAMRVSAIAIGEVAIVGLPGEPFSDTARELKANKDYKLVIPCCCANGYEGYFPPKAAYEKLCYEARESIFRPGVAEAVADTAVSLLNQMKPQQED